MPAPLTISGISANNKSYDRTNSATFSVLGPTLSGVIGADAVSFGGVTGSFASNQAGKNVPITGLNVALTGAQANDYTAILANAPLAANILPIQLTIIQIVADKNYDSTTRATITSPCRNFALSNT